MIPASLIDRDCTSKCMRRLSSTLGPGKVPPDETIALSCPLSCPRCERHGRDRDRDRPMGLHPSTQSSSWLESTASR
jgi:hypothetical protein